MKLKLNFEAPEVIVRDNVTIVNETAYVDLYELPLFSFIEQIPFVKETLKMSNDYSFFDNCVVFTAKGKAKCHSGDVNDKIKGYHIAQTRATIKIMKKYKKMINDIYRIINPMIDVLDDLNTRITDNIYSLNDHLSFDLT